MRNTVHVADAEDYIRFRPLFQPPMDRALSGTFGGRLSGVDRDELAAVAAGLLSRTPHQLPEYDNLLLSYAERSRVIPHRRPVPLPPGMCASSRMEMSN